MVDPLLLTFVAPIVVIVASAIGLRFGFPFGSPFHLMPLFSWWPGILHEGVQQSCLIAESECIGATATVYIVSGFWFMAVVTLIASAAHAHLRPEAGWRDGSNRRESLGL
ncbi:hypothetical protein [Mesorhizobium sp. M1342]|uniref:hypothetical protein n=1 Tax=Mesorhizobium sp. M1342 TaxID=2957088 RepID=UPI00333DB89A